MHPTRHTAPRILLGVVDQRLRKIARDVGGGDCQQRRQRPVEIPRWNVMVLRPVRVMHQPVKTQILAVSVAKRAWMDRGVIESRIENGPPIIHGGLRALPAPPTSILRSRWFQAVLARSRTASKSQPGFSEVRLS